MGIPAIEPYPMPVESDLPENTVSWTVDPARAVLLVHDMQRYFLRPFPTGESPVTDLVGNAVLIRQRCAELGIPVVYTAQPGSMTEEQRGLLKDFWGPGMTAGPADRRVVDELEPAAGDTVLTKWRPSAFFRTGLRDLLWGKGRDQIIIVGVYAHVGILMTAGEACAHDIRTFVVADAVADFSWPDHRLTLEYAANRCAMVVSTRTVLDQLPEPAKERP
ncbi:isochorismatase family protein [Streptomyces sp. W16]|uniref:isochorismatase family protein n=1 Tax=Streptomyces sp. W16 TaxID=3076631 RepID=UPI00295AE059|nr:isochorismatase family protein [Streptomyces sp. W16]MDV9169074.1 isochorismatase family protein [Streptomyces sp. W16]